MSNSSPVFVDTSGWIALLNFDDTHHDLATSIAVEIAQHSRPLITTDWVLAESGNGLARSQLRSDFVRATRAFIASDNTLNQVFKIDERLRDLALELYEKVSDKTWGLVDCASFTVMEQLGVRDALTSDRHFHQAGFGCLLIPTS